MENFELTEETKALLREKEVELVKILEALDALSKNKDFKTLQELLFSKSQDAVERQIKNESLAQEINTDKLYKLQGEWVWVRQFMDIPSFVKTLRRELEAIKTKLK